MKTIAKEFHWRYFSTDPKHLNEFSGADEGINQWLKENEGYSIKSVSVLTLNDKEDWKCYYNNEGRILVIFEKL